MIAKLSKNVHGLFVIIIGSVVLFLLYKMEIRIQRETAAFRTDLNLLENNGGILVDSIGDLRSLVDLKSKDLQNLRKGFSEIAKSKKSLYEAGLSLQEERRLLEKQFEMMTTYLKIDEQTRKISLMHGEQALQDFEMLYPAVTGFGGETHAVSSLIQIVSKERFAHPERGSLEESSGTIKWNPPQVGNSVRSNALGEYVMFTSSPLILHGPPKKKTEHESFPHLCLGLSLKTAQKLYANSFIGTKIVCKTVPSPVQDKKAK